MTYPSVGPGLLKFVLLKMFKPVNGGYYPSGYFDNTFLYSQGNFIHGDDHSDHFTEQI